MNYINIYIILYTICSYILCFHHPHLGYYLISVFHQWRVGVTQTFIPKDSKFLGILPFYGCCDFPFTLYSWTQKK